MVGNGLLYEDIERYVLDTLQTLPHNSFLHIYNVYVGKSRCVCPELSLCIIYEAPFHKECEVVDYCSAILDLGI